MMDDDRGYGMGPGRGMGRMMDDDRGYGMGPGYGYGPRSGRNW